MTSLDELTTPAALVDVAPMQRNIDRMPSRMRELSVKFRPHVETTQCVDNARAQAMAAPRRITISTLKEAEQFFAAGSSDILYAVGMVPSNFAQALASRVQGCDLARIG